MKHGQRIRGLIALAIAIGLTAVIPGCDNDGNALDRRQAAQTTALLIDRSSLPSHRHVDAIDQLSRHYLALQAPGDHLLIALSPDEGSGQASTAGLKLADRPLASTRQLRRIRSLLEESEDGRWHRPASGLPTLIEQMNTESSRRCLYLALDPRSATLPEDTERPDGERSATGKGWHAFLLTPAPHEPKQLQGWISWLHHRGAERIQRLPLSASPPRCPSL